MLNFIVSDEEYDLIKKIADRASSLYHDESSFGWGMDICLLHCNGCRLRLKALFEADDSDFKHDIAGIHNNLNRKTGKLGNTFLPRHAEEEIQ